MSDRPARIFAIVALMLFSEGFFNLVADPNQASDEVSFLRYVWPPIYLLTIVALVPHARDAALTARRNWIVLLVVALCLASTFWSVDVGTSLRRSIGLLFTSLFGLWLAVRFAPEERLRLMGWAFFWLAAGSTVLALALPSYGIMQEVHPGAWNGAFAQKNKLGQVMVYGAAVFAVIAVTDAERRRSAVAALLLCTALVVLSGSVTSLLALAVVAAVILSATVLLERPVLAVLAIYGSLMAAAALTIGLVLDADAVFQLIGRDASMTGRTDIWAPLWERLQTRPWTGFGYGAFWDDPEGPAWTLRRQLQWDVPSAHNGWVELWLDVGLGGVLLFGVSFLAATAQAVRAAFRGVEPGSLWCLVFLTLFLLFSISESSIMRQNNLQWVMYIATVATFGWRPEPRRGRLLPTIVWPDRGGAAAPPDRPFGDRHF